MKWMYVFLLKIFSHDQLIRHISHFSGPIHQSYTCRIKSFFWRSVLALSSCCTSISTTCTNVDERAFTSQMQDGRRQMPRPCGGNQGRQKRHAKACCQGPVQCRYARRYWQSVLRFLCEYAELSFIIQKSKRTYSPSLQKWMDLIFPYGERPLIQS